MVTPTVARITYFSNAVWSDRLPRLLQIRLIEAFENSRALKAVAARGLRMNSDYELASTIRSFHVVVSDDRAMAYVSIFAVLVAGKGGEVIAAREFAAEVPAASDSPAAGVAALNKAFIVVAKRIVRWAAGTPDGE
jgi:cholesterol transport system auxiliary component